MVFAVATFDTVILYNTEVQLGHPNLAYPICLAESECLKYLQTFTFCSNGGHDLLGMKGQRL